MLSIITRGAVTGGRSSLSRLPHRSTISFFSSSSNTPKPNTFVDITGAVIEGAVIGVLVATGVGIVCETVYDAITKEPKAPEEPSQPSNTPTSRNR